MLKYAFIALLAGLVDGCALFSGSPKTPVPQTLPVLESAHWFQVGDLDNNRQSLLAVQSLQDEDGMRWRWVQTDAFGAPLARQVVDAQGWRNDGFVPPNARASRLFSALLAVLSGGGAALGDTYPQLTAETVGDATTVYRKRNGREVWRIRAVSANEWHITTAVGERWQVRIIE